MQREQDQQEQGIPKHFDSDGERETVPSQTSDMGQKTVLVLAHSFVL